MSIPISLLQQREIEAKVLGPLIRRFASEFGAEVTAGLVREVISDLAHQSGKSLAPNLGSETIEAFAQSLSLWKEGDALTIETLDQSSASLDFNVTRCRYAEMYRNLGLADLGFNLSCVRDSSLIEGFNPAIRLTRTQTIMEGASYCDFRFRAQDDTGTDADPESGLDVPAT